MPDQTHPLTSSDPVVVYVRNHRGSVVIDTRGGPPRVELSSRTDGDLEGVTIDDSGERVVVDVPRRRFGRQPKVAVVVHVAPGSSADVETASASVATIGELDEVEVSTASGTAKIDRVRGDVRLSSASGGLIAGAVGGDLTAGTASGTIRAGIVDGRCELSSASGAIELQHGGGDVTVKTTSGAIAVRSLRRGTADLVSTSGAIKVGVERGVLVWLDVAAVSGGVRSELDGDAVPADGEEPLRLSAHTISGGIRLVRSAPVAAAYA